MEGGSRALLVLGRAARRRRRRRRKKKKKRKKLTRNNCPARVKHLHLRVFRPITLCLPLRFLEKDCKYNLFLVISKVKHCLRRRSLDPRGVCLKFLLLEILVSISQL